MTVFTSPVQEVFSFGAYPDGTRIMPLALPYSSVVILPLNTVEEFPAIHLNAGSESRNYQGGGVKDRFLTVTVRCYVNEEDAQVALGALLEDVETVLEKHSRLTYFDSRFTKHSTQQITIISIDTDEGVLEPLGVGEMIIEVRY